MISDKEGLQHNSFMCTCKVFNETETKEVCSMRCVGLLQSDRWSEEVKYLTNKCSKTKLNKKTVKSQVLSKAYHQIDLMTKLLIFSKWVLVE